MINDMSEKSKKFIELSSDKIKEISKIKGVSIQAVYKALRYETQSSLAMFIRAWAMNNGGTEYVAQINNRKVTVL